MTSPAYITVAVLIVPFFIVTTAAAFEEIVSIPQQMYDLSEENPSETKRYPDHFNAAKFSLWFNVGECPISEDGVKKFYCPSLRNNRTSVCIDDHQLCNGIKECPNAEDENATYCLFYKVLKSSVQGLQRDVQNLVSRHMRSPARRYSYGITHQQYR